MRSKAIGEKDSQGEKLKAKSTRVKAQGEKPKGEKPKVKSPWQKARGEKRKAESVRSKAICKNKSQGKNTRKKVHKAEHPR